MLNAARVVARRTATVFALAFGSVNAHAIDAQLAAPPGAQISEIAPALRINGVPTRVRSFHLAAPVAEVEQHYREALGAATSVQQLAGWTVLTRVRAQRVDTVQLRSDGAHGTEGMLSSAELEAARDARAHFPAPPGSVRQIDLETQEHGADARFIVWHGARSLAAAARHVGKTLGARGWQLERSMSAPEGTARGLSLWFRGSDGEAIAVLVDHAGSVSISLALIGAATGNAR